MEIVNQQDQQQTQLGNLKAGDVFKATNSSYYIVTNRQCNPEIMVVNLQSGTSCHFGVKVIVTKVNAKVVIE